MQQTIPATALAGTGRDDRPFGVVRAPDLDRPGLLWFNTPGPLSLKRLAGRLVILEFWTLGCVNCHHVVPSLRAVEDAFPRDVSVIGVHCPKFPAEREPAQVTAAIARLGIRHPVVHDPDRALWSQFGVKAWPTLVFVSPDGYVIGHASGEPDPARLLRVVAQTLDRARSERRLAPGDSLSTPQPAPSPVTAGRLHFPARIVPLPGEPVQWAVADSGHHRIAILDDAGAEMASFGDGRPGFRDGNAATVRFRGPQGLIADGAAIYVADTGNHALRRIDRASGRVTTIAGQGIRGRRLSDDPVSGPLCALASPWDVALRDGQLLFTNAGTHQLGLLDLAEGTVRRLAGTGAEGLQDGPAKTAALAQPSALAMSANADRLFFADAESSAVRSLDLLTDRVETLVGGGLFDFGSADGPFSLARLQHPLGLAVLDPGRLLVADTYNSVVRLLDLERREVGTFGDRFLCLDPLCRPDLTPVALWVRNSDRILLVDGDGHRILELSPSASTYRTWAE